MGNSAVVRLQVTNWEKYQTESKRVKNPSWFRFENKIYMDPVWDKLDHQAGEFSAWVFLLCFVSQNGNLTGGVETELKVLSRLSGLSETVLHGTITKLNHLGIVKCPEISGHVATIPEKSRLQYKTIQDSNIGSNTPSNADIPQADDGICRDHGATASRKRPRFDFEIPYADYPRKANTKKSVGMGRLKTRLKTAEQFEQLGIAVKNYADYCQREALEPRMIKQWATFTSEWEEWVEVKPPPVAGSSITDEDRRRVQLTMERIEKGLSI